MIPTKENFQPRALDSVGFLYFTHSFYLNTTERRWKSKWKMMIFCLILLQGTVHSMLACQPQSYQLPFLPWVHMLGGAVEGSAASVGRSCVWGWCDILLSNASLDRILRTNKYDTCGIERKQLVLFPATDLTAGELFGAELSEFESRIEAGAVWGGNHRFWLCHIPWGTQQFCDCSLGIN